MVINVLTGFRVLYKTLLHFQMPRCGLSSTFCKTLCILTELTRRIGPRVIRLLCYLITEENLKEAAANENLNIEVIDTYYKL